MLGTKNKNIFAAQAYYLTWNSSGRVTEGKLWSARPLHIIMVGGEEWNLWDENLLVSVGLTGRCTWLISALQLTARAKR